MIEMTNPRVRVPETAKAGELIEVRAMISHPMESGFRLNNMGQRIPRNIVQSFTCSYDGKEVFRARLHPAVSTNPYLVFYVVPTKSADLVFTWTDDHGGVASHIARLEVSATG
jgi:sulfur-oxidizing protein SoxZ